MSLASIGRPNSRASPSLAGSRPVSIFIVVVLPQPFEPTKPKISPRSMVKLTRSTAVKPPQRRRPLERPPAAAHPLRQQRDEGGLQVGGAGRRLELGRGAGREHAAGIH